MLLASSSGNAHAPPDFQRWACPCSWLPALGMPMLLASPVFPQRQDDSGVKHTSDTDSKDVAGAQQ